MARWVPPSYQPSERVVGAMQTPDGTWRVEVVRRNMQDWYRIVHGDEIIDWLTIQGVRLTLAEADIDIATLVTVVVEQPPVADSTSHDNTA